jgi:hypothetical protein
MKRTCHTSGIVRFGDRGRLGELARWQPGNKGKRDKEAGTGQGTHAGTRLGKRRGFLIVRAANEKPRRATP